MTTSLTPPLTTPVISAPDAIFPSPRVAPDALASGSGSDHSAHADQDAFDKILQQVKAEPATSTSKSTTAAQDASAKTSPASLGLSRTLGTPSSLKMGAIQPPATSQQNPASTNPTVWQAHALLSRAGVGQQPTQAQPRAPSSDMPVTRPTGKSEADAKVLATQTENQQVMQQIQTALIQAKAQGLANTSAQGPNAQSTNGNVASAQDVAQSLIAAEPSDATGTSNKSSKSAHHLESGDQPNSSETLAAAALPNGVGAMPLASLLASAGLGAPAQSTSPSKLAANAATSSSSGVGSVVSGGAALAGLANVDAGLTTTPHDAQKDSSRPAFDLPVGPSHPGGAHAGHGAAAPTQGQSTATDTQPQLAHAPSPTGSDGLAGTSSIRRAPFFDVTAASGGGVTLSDVTTQTHMPVSLSTVLMPFINGGLGDAAAVPLAAAPVPTVDAAQLQTNLSTQVVAFNLAQMSADPVKIQLRLRGDMLGVDVQATSAAAARSVDHDALRKSLESAGYAVESVSVRVVVPTMASDASNTSGNSTNNSGSNSQSQMGSGDGAAAQFSARNNGSDQRAPSRSASTPAREEVPNATPSSPAGASGLVV